jgi:DNA-binding MarR family transcriptional regulator
MPAVPDDRQFGDPDECLFALCARLAHRLGELYDDALLSTGLRTRDFLLLNTISDLTPCTIEQVAHATNLDPSSASEALDELVECKLIEFERRSAGIGGRLVSLTNSGRIALYEAYPRWSQMQKTVLASLGDDGRRLGAVETRLLEGTRNRP